jgi:hypothetical protein
MQIEDAGRHPGRAWQRIPAPGAATQRPLQQVSPVAQISPSTRQAGNSWQVVRPPSLGPVQLRPQHSSALAQGSPAGRQSGRLTHIPAMHTPLQQSCGARHGSRAARQAGLEQAPPAHPSEQQAPANVHA